MSKEVSLKDFYNNPEIEEEDQDSEQDSDFVPEGKYLLDIVIKGFLITFSNNR